MKKNNVKDLTPYQDINDICAVLSANLKNIFGDKLVGVYLTGSLTYGDFDVGSSDIDFLIVLNNALSKKQREQIKDIHAKIVQQHPAWAKRIEASYITKKMLQNEQPPKVSRPYVNGGYLWDPDPPYGHEWLLNLYVLYACGIALLGVDPKILIGHPIDIAAVRMASKNDFYQEWEPLLNEPSALKDSHFQAYVTLTLCRILHREKNDNVASKKVAAAWVKSAYGKPWSTLIEKAEAWQHGQEMNIADEILMFIRFVSQELQ